MPPCDKHLAAEQVGLVNVSILVLVDAALRPLTRLWQKSLYCVSILVLVDAALRQDHIFTLSASHKGFNPCFSGCRPATPLKNI